MRTFAFAALAALLVAAAMARPACPTPRECRCRPEVVLEHFIDENGCNDCRCVWPATTSAGRTTTTTARTTTTTTRTTTTTPRTTTTTTTRTTTTTTTRTTTTTPRTTTTERSTPDCSSARTSCNCKPGAVAQYYTDHNGCRVCECVHDGSATTRATTTTTTERRTTTTTARTTTTTTRSTTTTTTTTRTTTTTTTRTTTTTTTTRTTTTERSTPDCSSARTSCNCKPGAVAQYYTDRNGCHVCECVHAGSATTRATTTTTTERRTTTTTTARTTTTSPRTTRRTTTSVVCPTERVCRCKDNAIEVSFVDRWGCPSCQCILAGFIDGTVEEEDGTPVADALVTATQQGQPTTRRRRDVGESAVAATTTDGDGKFSFKLAPGSYLIQVYRGDILVGSVEVEVPAGETADTVVVVELPTSTSTSTSEPRSTSTSTSSSTATSTSTSTHTTTSSSQSSSPSTSSSASTSSAGPVLTTDAPTPEPVTEEI